jgi:hypothetical protein
MQHHQPVALLKASVGNQFKTKHLVECDALLSIADANADVIEVADLNHWTVLLGACQEDSFDVFEL